MNENLENIRLNLEQFLSKVSKFQLDSKSVDFNIQTKSSVVDFVTDIDKKSDEMIIEFINKNYPSHQLLTEEHGILGPKSEWCWVIDPIDGTTNFIHSYPLHSISVGLKYKDETVLGVVVLPVLNMKFHAIKGSGAFLNDKQIFVSKQSNLEKSLISTGFPYSRAIHNPNLVYFNKIINKIAGIRRSGSAAIDICFTAAGYTDGYFEFNINEWDYCAGRLILKEAGGRCYEKKICSDTMFIFTNSYVDEKLLKTLFD